MIRDTRLVTALIPAILAVGWLVFAPALSGPFFFDDYAHLPKLAGNGGGIDTASEVFRLAFPAHGGSGRSLAYLSLLVDDYTWPTTPEGFKRTNLLIHLLNGVLVFAFLRQLARILRPSGAAASSADWVALAGAGLWLLNPIHLSPTMMVIQRMTLLGGTFSLLALIAYLHGRRIAPERPLAGILWLVPVFGAALVLGILSKETAFLTIAYVVALELTLLGPDNPPRPPWWNAWAFVFLIVPLVLLGLYLGWVAGDMADAYRTRAFDLTERLLTEGRVLMEYLRVILLPSLTHTGPFRDDFAVSHGLLDPPETVAALGAIAFLLGLAVWGRRRWPLFSFAVLWFFFGHLLESTVLPLELYFEHRNYLPMLGLVFAVCYRAMTLAPKMRRLAVAGLAAFLALEAAITHASGEVWGSLEQIAIHWAAERPGSPRAQIVALNHWAVTGRTDRLRRQLDQATALDPRNSLYPMFRFVIDRCSDRSLPTVGGSLKEVEQAVPTAHFEYGSMEIIEWLAARMETPRCRVSAEEMQHILALYLANPQFNVRADSRNQLYLTLGRVKKQQGDLDGTIRALDSAYSAKPFFGTALSQAYLLATAGLFAEAEGYIKRAEAAPLRTLYDWLERDSLVAEYRKILRDMQMHGESSPAADLPLPVAERAPVEGIVP